jgi:hypothetical protein
MTISNSANISVFEGLQANANASMGAGSTSQMSVFNAWKVNVSKAVTDAFPDSDFTYQDKSKAEKDVTGWKGIKAEKKAGEKGTLVYLLSANGRRFETTDAKKADGIVAAAKQASVVEV